MTDITIKLLGPQRVLVRGVPVTSFYSTKVRALLAYLAAEHSRPHRRESLCALLWSEYPETRARANLSQAIYALRRALARPGTGADSALGGAWLLINRGSVELRPTGGCWVDVVEFQSLVETSKGHGNAEALSARCAESLERAVSLYEGEFLQGFSLQGSAAFEEWLLIQRAHMQKTAVDSLGALANHYAECGNWPVAIAHARRWTELAPLDEQGRRQLMRLLASNGQRAVSVDEYVDLRRLLLQEIGIDPDPSTTALYERIRDGRYAARANVANLSPPPLPGYLDQEERYRPLPFHGREQELSGLKTHLETVLCGHAQIVFVSGEAGSGKTALIHAFSRQAQHDHTDLVVASGRCNAHTGIGDPYSAWREIMAQLGGDIEERWTAGAIGREHASRLWRMLPYTSQALSEIGPDLAGVLVDHRAILNRAEPAAATEAAWLSQLRDLVATRRTEVAPYELQRSALFQQYTAVLQRLAREHPLLLVVDDLHWADTGTISLLFHLETRLASDRILIVGAYRPEELAQGRVAPLSQALGTAGADQRHPLEPVLCEFQRRRGEIVVDLGQAESRRLIDAVIDAEPNALGDDFRGELDRMTSGNALFITEWLRVMRERGDLARDADGRWIVGAAVNWERVPTRVDAVIAERVGRLPPLVREALVIGSVEGETFNAEVVARVLGVGARGLVRALSIDAGRRHNLIVGSGLRRLGGQSLSGYQFQHILIQKRLYDNLDATERSNLHGALGDAIEGLYADRKNEAAIQLARHYREAGDTEKAIGYLVEAANTATRLLADRESVDHLAEALRLLRTLPHSAERDTRELQLLIALAPCLQAMVGFTDAEMLAVSDRARELCQQVGDPDTLVRALEFTSTYYGLRADWRTALCLMEGSVDSLQRIGANALEAGMRYLRTFALFGVGDFARVVSEMRLAESLIEPDAYVDKVGGRGMVWKLYGQMWMACSLLFLGHVDQAMTWRARAVQAAERIAIPFFLNAVTSIAKSQIALFMHDWEPALEAAHAEMRYAADKDFPSFKAMSLCHQGRAEVGLGRTQEALAHLREGTDLLMGIGTLAYVPYFYIFMAEAHGMSGEAARGMTILDQAESMMRESGGLYCESDLLRVRAQLLLSSPAPDHAMAEAAL